MLHVGRHRPSDIELEQLHEICARVRHRHIVRTAGLRRAPCARRRTERPLLGSIGNSARRWPRLIAADLELDIYRIDLSQVLDKYVGETEKRLESVFDAGEASGAVLFFDEADAVFGKRSETKDAHDRYANIEVAYLLQRIEHYGGIAVLATNLRSNLDAAFMRRLSFAIEFPAPDTELRKRIWGKVGRRAAFWPRTSTSTSCRNASLCPAVSSGTSPWALRSSPRQKAGLSRCVMSCAPTCREYQKLGNRIVSSEFDPYAELLS